MNVARFTESGRTRLGVVIGDHVADDGAKPGSTVRIESIGTIENPVVAQP